MTARFLRVRGSCAAFLRKQESGVMVWFASAEGRRGGSADGQRVAASAGSRQPLTPTAEALAPVLIEGVLATVT